MMKEPCKTRTCWKREARAIKTFLIAVLLTASVGCASHAVNRMAPEFGAMPIRSVEGNIHVAADPYIEAERQTSLFEADLGKCGVLPVRVMVRNAGERAVWLRCTEVTLELQDGKRLAALDVFTLGRCGSTQAAGEQPSLVTPPTQPMWGLGPQAGSLAGLIGAAAGLAGYAAAESGARDPRVANYQRNELRGALLRKNDATHGFVFFSLAADEPAPERAELVLRLHDVADESSFAIRLPLAGSFLRRERP
jgi:hypothetical protein